MDLSRAHRKFATTMIQSWNAGLADWVDTDCYGALQAFDRFITERTFGQKKRILTMPGDVKLPADVTVVRLAGSEEAFLVEKYNEDVQFGKVYGYIYLLHEAPYHVAVCKAATAANAAGVLLPTGESVLAETWIDLERFTSTASRSFEENEYTVVVVTLPTGTVVDTDTYLKLDSGVRYNVDEVYDALDLVVARGKRVGVTR